MCIRDRRIVVDVRKDANAQVILNQLYQYTQLQDTVGVIMLAIDHKVPKEMCIRDSGRRNHHQHQCRNRYRPRV